MNAIYCCCIYDVWYEVSKQLLNKYKITPAYFIGWETDINVDELYSLNKLMHIQSVEDAFKGIGFPDIDITIDSSIDEYIYKKYSFEILNGVKMMDRLDYDQKSFPASQRIYWFCSLIEVWLGIIKKKNIDIVFSPSVPHRVFDYALYVACLIKNVRFIMFQHTSYGILTLLIEDIESIKPIFNESNISLNFNEKKDILKTISKCTKRIENSYKTAQPYYMKEQEKSYNRSFIERWLVYFDKFLSQPMSILKFSYSYYVSDGLSPDKSKSRKFTQILMGINKRTFLRKLKKEYNKVISEDSKPIDKKYFLLALHYQPEETSCPTGGFFSDQRQIVKLLIACLPKNILIYIKEHKTQFHPDYEGQTGRNLNYYKDLQEISDRVKFVGSDADPFTLIDNSVAVVTISGTIGWEAIIRGKPALVFGRAWYENMPGAFRIKTTNNLVEAYEIINSTEVNRGKDGIKEYEKNISLQLVNAVHYKSAQHNRDLTEVESANNIVLKLIERLELSEK